MWGWLANEFMPQMHSLLAHLPATSTAPPADQAPSASDSSQDSWWWQFSTGPALGGVLALAAAILAFVRLGHQVAETRRGNDLTARKNSDDQWWDTLKWTYTEAKDSQSEGSTFRTVAAARILDSLNHNHDQLTVQQQRAVESILDMFAESNEPEVQEAVAPIYQSFGRISVSKLEEDVFATIANMALPHFTIDLERSHHFANQKASWDAVLVASNAQEVIIEVSSNYRFFKLNRLVEYVNEAPNRRAVVVTDQGITSQQYEAIRAKTSRISTVAWNEQNAAKELEHMIRSAFEAN